MHVIAQNTDDKARREWRCLFARLDPTRICTEERITGQTKGCILKVGKSRYFPLLTPVSIAWDTFALDLLISVSMFPTLLMFSWWHSQMWRVLLLRNNKLFKMLPTALQIERHLFLVQLMQPQKQLWNSMLTDKHSEKCNDENLWTTMRPQSQSLTLWRKSKRNRQDHWWSAWVLTTMIQLSQKFKISFPNFWTEDRKLRANYTLCWHLKHQSLPYDDIRISGTWGIFISLATYDDLILL